VALSDGCCNKCIHVNVNYVSLDKLLVEDDDESELRRCAETQLAEITKLAMDALRPFADCVYWNRTGSIIDKAAFAEAESSCITADLIFKKLSKLALQP